MKLFLIISVFTIASACSDESTTVQSEYSVETVERNFDPVEYSKGQKLYQLNCASCHGKYAEGAPNWRKVDADGKFPAPPLNGTGHTWHHSTKVLTQIIKDGTGKLGGNMPAWKDQLSDKEIEAILTWVKAQWPDEIYSAWYNNFYSQ